MPPPSLNLYVLACGLALRMRVSVKAIDGISRSRWVTVSAKSTVIDTVNFSGCKRSCTNVDESERNLSVAISKA
jgi:hypothetical protein